MAAAIDFSGLKFGTDEIRELGELVKKLVTDVPALTDAFTIYPNIRNKKEIGLIRPSLGLIGVLDAGCGAAANTEGQAPVSKKVWDTARISVIHDECYADLENNFVKFLRKTGVDIADLTTTEYFDYLLSFLPKDVLKMVWRKALFEKKNIANVSAGGTLKNGIDVKYFNTFDGIFEQAKTLVTANPDAQVVIAENGQATKALQFSTLTPEAAYTYFTKLNDAAPSPLTSQEDRIYIATRSITVKAARYLQKTGTDTVLTKLENGYEVTTIDGIKVLVVPYIDEIIKSYFDNGTKLDAPHRIILTTVSNLGIGFESETGFADIKVIFDEMTEKNRIKIKDAMDAKIIDDDNFLIAW